MKHRVHQGERLSTIARHYGVSHEQFLAANPDRETTTLPSGERVFRSLSTGDELELPQGVGAPPSPPLPADPFWRFTDGNIAWRAAPPPPREEPRALGAVEPFPLHPSQRPEIHFRYATREDIPRRTLPKIGKQGTAQQQQQQPAKSTPSQIMYQERKHLLDLAQRALGIIDTPLGPLLGAHGKQTARTAQYQNIQRVVQELGTYASFNATHVSNITATRKAIQALGQQVDVYGTLVISGGTETQIEDAYHNMRAAAQYLMVEVGGASLHAEADPATLGGYRDATGKVFLHRADDGCQGWQIKATESGIFSDSIRCYDVASPGEFAYYDPDHIGQCPKGLKAIKVGGIGSDDVSYIVCAGMSNAAEPINPECPSYLVCPSKAAPTPTYVPPQPAQPAPTPTTTTVQPKVQAAPAAAAPKSSWLPWVGLVASCAGAAAIVGIAVGSKQT